MRYESTDLRAILDVTFTDLATEPRDEDLTYAGYTLTGSIELENDSDRTIRSTDRFSLTAYNDYEDAAQLCEASALVGRCLADAIVTTSYDRPLTIEPRSSASFELRGWEAGGPHPLGFPKDLLAAMKDHAARGIGPDLLFVGGGSDQPEWQRACLSDAAQPGEPSGPIAVVDGRGRIVVSVETGDPDELCSRYVD